VPEGWGGLGLGLGSGTGYTRARGMGRGVAKRRRALVSEYAYSDAKVANRTLTVGDFGREIAHEAVSRPPPTCLYTMVARTHRYTYDAKVWDVSIVQGPFSVAPFLRARSLTLRFAAVASLCSVALTCSP
jgi:hypothetical protein